MILNVVLRPCGLSKSRSRSGRAASFMLFVSCAALLPLATGSPLKAAGPTTSVTTSTYVCAKCGKVHTRPMPSSASASVPVSSSTIVSTSPAGTALESRPTASSTAPYRAARVSYDAPSTSAIGSMGSRVRGAASNVLATLNSQRARQGLRRLRYDPQLQAVASRRAQLMASRGMKGHPPGSFSPGRYEGVGWSSSFSPSGVRACFTSDPRMQVAGAAMATGRDGVYFCVVYR